jgi:hypothetical protein
MERSAWAERVHPLDVPGHGDEEAPLAANAIEPAQQKLAESHHRFDDTEHRFTSLALAARAATPTIPTIFLLGSDPVQMGLTDGIPIPVQ